MLDQFTAIGFDPSAVGKLEIGVDGSGTGSERAPSGKRRGTLTSRPIQLNWI